MTSTAEFVPFSLPRYATATSSGQASLYVLVTEGEGLAERDAHLARLPLTVTALQHLALPHYGDLAQLGQALLGVLQGAHVGVQMELVGDEAFIWTLHVLAQDAGLLGDEIVLTCTQAGGRKLFCVHCATVQTATAETLQNCAHCGVQLEVRRHFSQRLGAYLGVCADADQPYGESRHE